VLVLYDEQTEARATQAQLLALFSEDVDALATRALALALYDETPDVRVTQLHALYIHGNYQVYPTMTATNIVGLLADSPVTELWAWQTDVMTSANGTEQRQGFRRMPKITQRSTLLSTDEDEINAFVRHLMYQTQGRVFMPQYQYGALLTAGATAGAMALSFDTGRTDIRDGEVAVIVNGSSRYLIYVDTVSPTGVTLSEALTVDVTTRTWVCPAIECIVNASPQVRRRAVNNVAYFDAVAELSRTDRTTLVRPGSSAVIDVYDGYPVLTERPLADSNVVQTAITGAKKIGGDPSITDSMSWWLMPQMGIGYEFYVKRIMDPGRLDWWRAFLDEIRGSLRPFLMPSYREEIATDYATQLFVNPSFRRLRFDTAFGVYYRTVASVEESLGNSVCQLTSVLPSDSGADAVSSLGLLLKMRLADDKAEWTHEPFESFLKLAMRSVAE